MFVKVACNLNERWTISSVGISRIIYSHIGKVVAPATHRYVNSLQNFSYFIHCDKLNEFSPLLQYTQDPWKVPLKRLSQCVGIKKSVWFKFAYTLKY